MSAIFVGFDSAWANNPKAPGAICSVRFDGEGFSDFRAPRLVSFDDALAYVNGLRRLDLPMLVALDQPTIVPNRSGMRPVEKAVASLISWMGGGVQPANRGRLAFFSDSAPIWAFLDRLRAEENPESARTAERGLHLMEVFPALALASLDAGFFGRLKGPRYNPARPTFKIEHWNAVVGAAKLEADCLGCATIAAWLGEQRGILTPKKSDQDCLDSALCLLIALRWRLGAREQSVAIGDLKNGYIVTPVSGPVLERLSEAAKEHNVPIDALGKPNVVRR